MRSLLDNRKDLTPQQSMESLVKYARTQDSALLARNSRRVRAGQLFTIIVFTSLGVYCIKQFIFGYWTQHLPRGVLSAATDGIAASSREYFAPEIYFKDLENWKIELQKKELQVLKSKQIN